MKQFKVEDIRERCDGYYNEEEKITNFTVQLKKLKINVATQERTYVLEFRMENGTQITQEIPATEINTGKWFSRFPSAIWCCNKKAFSAIFQQLLALAEGEHQTIEMVSPKTGFQKVDGAWHFLFSNGSFSMEGFDTSVYSTRPFFVYNGEGEWVDEGDTAAYLKLICRYPRDLYLILALNLLSTTNGFFKDYGIDLAATLWLDGHSGSGKTTLAQTFGKFTDPYIVRPDETGSWHNRWLLSSTEKTAVVVETLNAHSGETVILDDIKAENNQRQRDKSNAAVDIVIRSVYRGTTTERARRGTTEEETSVETCAILNGEFRCTYESQNARMFLSDVDEFMQNQKKREVLTEAQINWQRQTNLIGGFIRWLIFKALDPDIESRWWGLMEHIRSNRWEYEDRPNGQRLKDTRARFLFITKVFGMYLRERFPHIENEIQEFLHKAAEAVEWAAVNTFENLNGLHAVATTLMKAVLEDLVVNGGIRSADYDKTYLGSKYYSQWDQEQFCLLEFSDEDHVERSEKALLIPQIRKSFQNTEQQGTAVGEGPMLVMARTDLEMMLRKYTVDFINEGVLWEGDEKKINVPFLAQIGVLLMWPEAGRNGRYSKKYPLIQYEKTWRWDGDRRQDVYEAHLRYEECVCFNPSHEIVQGILQKEYKTKRNLPGIPMTDSEMALRARKAFVDDRIKFSEKFCKRWGCGGI